MPISRQNSVISNCTHHIIVITKQQYESIRLPFSMLNFVLRQADFYTGEHVHWPKAQQPKMQKSACLKPALGNRTAVIYKISPMLLFRLKTMSSGWARVREFLLQEILVTIALDTETGIKKCFIWKMLWNSLFPKANYFQIDGGIFVEE